MLLSYCMIPMYTWAIVAHYNCCSSTAGFSRLKFIRLHYSIALTRMNILCSSDTFVHFIWFSLRIHRTSHIFANIFAMKLFDFNNIVRVNLIVSTFQNRFNMSFNHINQTFNTFDCMPTCNRKRVFAMSECDSERERENAT